jgi:crossover junction endodeoxyribonuclease RuvC
VIDVAGHALHYVASGTIRTTHLERGNLPARLKVLYDGIAELRQRYQPDVAAVEIVFVNTNPQATLLLGQARGACLTALVACDLAVAEYTRCR